MNKYFLTAITAIPMLFQNSNAAQIFAEPGQQVYMTWPGDEAGTGAYLGVDVNDVTSDRLGALKLKEEKGVEVTMVDQDAPAGKAGIKEHDVILSVNGNAVDSAAALRRVIHETPAGRVITLLVSRDGQQMTLKAQLADRNKLASAWPKAMKDVQIKDLNVVVPPIPPMPEFDMPNAVVVVRSSMRSGLSVENLTPQLGEFFGVKEGKGVLVRGVDKGSRAEQAGLKAGDVIVRINDQPVHDTTDFSYALRRSHDGKSVTLGVMRDKHEQTLTLQQPEAKETGELQQESWDDMDFDVADDADQVMQVQMLADIKPQMIAISNQSAIAAQKALKAACEQQQKQWAAQSKAWSQQAAKWSQQSKEISEKVQKETQDQLRELQRKMHEERLKLRLDI